jgi:hypothetical protein
MHPDIGMIVTHVYLCEHDHELVHTSTRNMLVHEHAHKLTHTHKHTLHTTN